MSDIHIEFYLGTAQSVLAYDYGGVLGTYSLEQVELHSTYLSSKSIQSFFSSNPVAISCTDYSYRYNSVSGLTNMLKISSSYTSLNSIIGYFRGGDAPNAPRDRRRIGYNSRVVSGMQMFVNNTAIYDIPLSGVPQLFREFIEAFPDVEMSDYYTDFGLAAQFLVCVNLRASPKEFHGAITSGTSTSTLNSDLCLQLDLSSNLSGMDAALESFLCADVVLHMVGKDLHVKY